MLSTTSKLSVVARAALLATLSGSLCGCSSLLGGGGPPELRSANGSARLGVTFTHSAYSPSDSNTADLYLTDLAPEDRLPGADLAGVSGQFLHVHLFLDPMAGQTPLDQTACNIVVRYLIIAGNDIGLYGGGGFMPLSATPGEDQLGGDIKRASLRLLGATPTFDDRLGNAELAGSVAAPKNDDQTKEMAKQFEEFIRRLPPPQ